MGRFILGTDFLYKAQQSIALVVLQTKKGVSNCREILVPRAAARQS